MYTLNVQLYVKYISRKIVHSILRQNKRAIFKSCQQLKNMKIIFLCAEG